MWGAIIAAIGALYSAGSAKNAATRAESTAEINARLIGQESVEEERRLRKDMAQTEALSNALTGASGVQMSGSRKAFMDEMRAEHSRQIDWLQKSTRQKQRVVRRGGQLQSSQLQSQAYGQAIQGVAKLGQAFSQYSSTSKTSNTSNTGGS